MQMTPLLPATLCLHIIRRFLAALECPHIFQRRLCDGSQSFPCEKSLMGCDHHLSFTVSRKKTMQYMIEIPEKFNVSGIFCKSHLRYALFML